MTTDPELLARYLDHGREDAFGELVSRYLPLVRGAVWRGTGRADLIDEVAMQVFADLARKAPTLRRLRSVGGWLIVASRMKAAEALRKDDTRRRYMKKLANHQEVTSEGSEAQDDLWNEASPLLDDALSSLPETDREAVVLHFYQGLAYREVGLRIGKREDATRKQVHTALKRMGAFFRRHGVALPAAALASGLTAQLAPKAMAAHGIPAEVLAKKSLALALNARDSATMVTTFLTMTTMKIWTTVATAALLLLLCTGAGYLTGQQRGEARRELIMATLAEHTDSLDKESSADSPLALVSDDTALRRLIDQMAQASLETEVRPSAWPDVVRLREKVQPDEFEQALEIVQRDYANDTDLLSRLTSYLIIDWAKHDGRAASERASDVASGDKLNGLLTGTLGEWGAQAPADALAWLESHADTLGNGATLNLRAQIYSGWASRDPNGALDAFENLDYDQQRTMIHRLWPAVADQTNRNAFIERVGQIEDQRLRVEIFERSISEALSEEPNEAAAAFDKLNLTDPSLRWRAINHIGDKLYSSDPAGTVDWIWERVSEDRYSEVITDWIASGWANIDRPSAEHWLSEHGYTPGDWLRPPEKEAKP